MKLSTTELPLEVEAIWMPSTGKPLMTSPLMVFPPVWRVSPAVFPTN